MDELFGNEGIDSLVGGTGEGDFLRGGGQSDRYLTFANDTILDFGSQDAQINFRNTDDFWTNGELEVIDNGLNELHLRTLNGRLLRDPIADLPIVFVKSNTLPQALRIGQNVLAQRFIDGELVTERQIRLADFNENDQATVDLFRYEIVREIAHSWASDEAIVAALPNQDTYFTQFESLSSWVSETPEDLSFFFRSDDNTQFYRRTAVFAPNDPLVTVNSAEDFASVWRLVFTPNTTAEQSQLPLKVTSINNLLNLLSS